MPGIVKISSRDNVHLKEAKRIRDAKRGDKIFVEGIRLVDEAVRSGLTIDSLFVTEDAMARAEDLITAAGARETYQLNDSVFRSIADTVNSQGLIAIANRPAAGRSEIENRLSTSDLPLVAFLYQTNNPSNLGAVIRTAEAAGAAGVIISTGSADEFSPKAIRAAMGSSFRLPIWAEVEVAEAIEWAASKDLRTAATEITATKDYTEVDWKQPHVIFLGSEAHGLPEKELGRVDEKILIPMDASVESLNLAVACGVILFEARRQNSAR